MNLSGGGLCSGKTTIDRIYSYLPDVASPGRMTVKHGVGNMLSIQKKHDIRWDNDLHKGMKNKEKK